MGRAKKQPPAATWVELEAKCLWEDQIAYELVRPVVLKEQTPDERAQEVGRTKKTIQRKVQQFIQFGLPGLVPTTGHRSDDKRVLPLEVRQSIMVLKAEHPALTAHEIATICELQFGRGSNYRVVQRVLETESLPQIRGRRFARFDDEPDPEQRRHNIIQLHIEGWTVLQIASYFEVSRQTVHAILRRWLEEGVAGLADKRAGPKGPYKASFPVMVLIQEYQRNPLIGKQRMHAYLKQQGYDISAGTCGRIMRLHRELVQQETPSPFKMPKKAMPFLALRRHQWWSVDIRYIEEHQVPGVVGPIYIVTVLDNYSRAVLASAPCLTQDLGSYLLVLFSALALYGAPEGIVSDGGAVFKATKAQDIYAQFDIIKERIEPRKPWQNYIEAHFGIMRRLADYYLARATSWSEFCQRHAEFVANYNEQDHFAHLHREDGFRSPVQVLSWVKGRPIVYAQLEEAFATEQVRRHLDARGYVQFRHWRLYASEGLVGKDADLVLYRNRVTVAYQDESVSQYQVQYVPETTIMEHVLLTQEFPERFPSRQPHLWDVSGIEWRKAIPVAPSVARRKVPPATLIQESLFPLEDQQRRRKTSNRK